MKAATVTAVILYLAAFAALIVGWFMNIIALVGMLGATHVATTELVIRLVGVIVAPFGGYIGWF